MPCSKCKQSGHNARSCKNDANVQEMTTEPVVADDLDEVVEDEAPPVKVESKKAAASEEKDISDVVKKWSKK